ncbi:MAG: hypothetical protein HYX96_01135 [Chloroflexi bacterium]|nr:hypothetical protein [Chloroflexota bacterium]
MTTYIGLSVNDAPVKLDYFVQEFVHRVVNGILLALRGTCEIETLQLSIDGDSVDINLNNAAVPANPFVSKIVKNTLFGMASTLKGVETINRLKIEIKR